MARKKTYSEEFKWIKNLQKDGYTFMIMPKGGSKKFYSGARIAFTNGYFIYMYIIPYIPSHAQSELQRVVSVKPGADYTDEINELFTYWVQNGATFPYDLCNFEYTSGSGELKTGNMGFTEYDPTVEDYVLYDINDTMVVDKKEEVPEENWETF